METVGVIGLGLLGRGIAACLLGHNLRVVAYTRSKATRDAARHHIEQAVKELVERGGFNATRLADWRERYHEVENLADLDGCDFVIESIFEDMEAKYETYQQIEAVLRPDVPIASNTSAIPITLIQARAQHPERFVGMHWSEPAHCTQFIEIIRGDKTNDATFEAAAKLACAVGKEPSLVLKDIRGFVTNRLCYALFREALFLLESGVADVETIDRSFRNDVGWWATIAGPFRWMDMTGLTAYYAVMKDLFPELDASKDVPAPMQQLMDEGAQGFKNGRGFYHTTPDEAEQWERLWYDWTWEIRRLIDKYPRPDSPPPTSH